MVVLHAAHTQPQTRLGSLQSLVSAGLTPTLGYSDSSAAAWNCSWCCSRRLTATKEAREVAFQLRHSSSGYFTLLLLV